MGSGINILKFKIKPIKKKMNSLYAVAASLLTLR